MVDNSVVYSCGGSKDHNNAGVGHRLLCPRTQHKLSKVSSLGYSSIISNFPVFFPQLRLLFQIIDV